MGLPEGSVKSFVLDNDPIPRAMLSVDPTFAMLKQSAPLSWVLEARRRFLGSGSALTPERFLYENVGEVYACHQEPVLELDCVRAQHVEILPIVACRSTS